MLTGAWKETIVTQGPRGKKEKHFKGNSKNLYVRTVFLWVSPILFKAYSYT